VEHQVRPARVRTGFHAKSDGGDAIRAHGGRRRRCRRRRVASRGEPAGAVATTWPGEQAVGGTRQARAQAACTRPGPSAAAATKGGSPRPGGEAGEDGGPRALPPARRPSQHFFQDQLHFVRAQAVAAAAAAATLPADQLVRKAAAPTDAASPDRGAVPASVAPLHFKGGAAGAVRRAVVVVLILILILILLVLLVVLHGGCALARVRPDFSSSSCSSSSGCAHSTPAGAAWAAVPATPTRAQAQLGRPGLQLFLDALCDLDRGGRVQAAGACLHHDLVRKAAGADGGGRGTLVVAVAAVVVRIRAFSALRIVFISHPFHRRVLLSAAAATTPPPALAVRPGHVCVRAE